ncbi:MAG TPA: hypothetical protein VKK31_09080 [Thermoanaerobaculia bacterium]|nr:hypothetical protein [Thermoanaerobaculia bacterium]
MFVGHYAVGLAGRAKTTAPRISLGTWFLAVQFLDLLWPIFLLLGWEHVRIAPGITRLTPLDFYDYPISHSLAGALAWSVVFAIGYLILGRGGAGPRERRRGALLLGAGVFSHWLLDFLTHRPDLPILPRGPYVGLGLWNVPAVAIALEAVLYGLGAFLYVRATTARDAAGRWGLWILLAILPVFWLAAVFGPPPPDERTLAGSALVLWLIAPWAWWVDRHRS